MKEHSLFLEVAFLEKNNNLKPIARKFQNTFADILKKAIILANGNITNNLLESNEIVTKNTVKAEQQTNNLSGSSIDTNITLSELNLKSGIINPNKNILNNISNLNKQTLPIIQNLIEFKNDILNNVLKCNMYTTNYPLLISHIMNEAKMYYNLLSKIENRNYLSQNELLKQELFWENIMKEHAQFIRGLLDPTENDLIINANKFALEYEKIIKNSHYVTSEVLNETIRFRDFKINGEEAILNCQLKSIIIPLLADHVVREANHFIRILKNFNN